MIALFIYAMGALDAYMTASSFFKGNKAYIAARVAFWPVFTLSFAVDAIIETRKK